MGLTHGQALPLPSRVSLARPVLSCAHCFQAPATQASDDCFRKGKMGLLIVFLAQPVYGPYSLYGVLRLTTVALLLMRNLNSSEGF